MADTKQSQPAQAAQQKGQPTQQSVAAPSVSGFRIRARRQVQPSELMRNFSELAFLELNVDKDSLVVLNVESRDIQKNPYLFSIITFKPDMIEAKYTCLANMSPKKRRIEVLRHFLNLLTLTEECYDIRLAEVFQLLESSISNMTEYVSSDYDKLYSTYDSLKTEHANLQKKVRDLTDSNASLSKENYELKSKNDDITLRLRGLETFSDQVLSLKIQEWLSEHKGEINIADFSKVYNVPENRVEQMLNKMVTEGFIELKG
jgi:DNA-binding IscR family transcriptional regulator